MVKGDFIFQGKPNLYSFFYKSSVFIQRISVVILLYYIFFILSIKITKKIAYFFTKNTVVFCQIFYYLIFSINISFTSSFLMAMSVPLTR